MAATLTAEPGVAPRSVTSRCFGTVTALMPGYQGAGGGLVPAAGAQVRVYAAGTHTPYALPLYGDPDTTTPLVFPFTLGNDGTLNVWADAPDRVDVGVEHAVGGAAGTALDLEPVPAEAAEAGDVYTKAESDGRYEPLDSAYTKAEADAVFLTAGEADSLFLTPAEGDARYALAGSTPTDVYTKSEADSKFVDAAGDTVTGALTLDVRPTVAGVAQPRISVQAGAPSSPATGDLWVW